MKVLVTGANGFVGNVLVRRLLQEKCDVHVFAQNVGWRLSDLLEKITIWPVDLCNQKAVDYSTKSINPDVVYHFAAHQASGDIKNVDNDISVNVVGTRNLLRALSETKYKLLVNAGSSSEYGVKNQAMHESHLLEPNSYHSFAKGAQTLLCQTAALTENSPIVTLRFFSVYGPYERPTRLIPTVIKGALHHQPLKLSQPSVGRDFVYVDDVIDACLKVEQLKKHQGEIINIGTGVQSTIQNVIDNVFSLTGQTTECLWSQDSRTWDTNIWVADCSKAYQLLNWSAKHTLSDGLEKTIYWTINLGKRT